MIFALFLQPYATTFPVISVDDMVNAQFLLMDHLGINKVIYMYILVDFCISMVHVADNLKINIDFTTDQ